MLAQNLPGVRRTCSASCPYAPAFPLLPPNTPLCWPQQTEEGSRTLPVHRIKVCLREVKPPSPGALANTVDVENDDRL